MSLARSCLFGFAFLPLLACTGRVEESTATPTPVEQRAIVRAHGLALTSIRAAFPNALVIDAPLMKKESGLALNTTERTNLTSLLPATANGAVHIANPSRIGGWIDVRSEGLNDVVGVVNDSSVTYEEVAVSLDLVHVAHVDAEEELRVLWDEKAPSRASWDVTLGPAIVQARARQGRFELLDARGYAVLQTAPILAIDARGETRELALNVTRLSSARVRLEAALDVSGLAYPIVVDPSWATVAPIPFTIADEAYLLPIAGSKAGLFDGSAKEAIYDLATNTWTKVTTINAGQSAYFAYEGGIVRTSNTDLRSLDVTNAAWTLLTTNITRGSGGYRSNYFAELPDKTVFMQPGRGIAQVCDLTAFTCTAAGTKNFNGNTNARSFVAALSQTAIFGVDGPSVSAMSGSVVDVYSGSFTWAAGAATKLSGAVGGAAASNGYLFGGYGVTAICTTGCKPTDSVGTAFRYSAGVGTPVNAAPMTTARGDVATATFPDNRHILVLGGMQVTGTSVTGTGGTQTISKTVELYDAANDKWTGVVPLVAARRRAYAVALDSTHVLAVSGTTSTTSVSDGEWSVLNPTFLQSVEVLTLPALGTACTLDADCGGLFPCVDGVCCATSACTPGQSCNGATPGTCAGRLGSTCSSGVDCGSGFCVDGVCCDGECTDVCGACNLPGKAGTCSIVTGTPLAGRSCPGGASGDPCALSCLGTDRAQCDFPTAVVCGSNTCSGGTETHSSVCDGAGKCSDTPRKCAPYACDVKACKSACADDTDCANGFSCSNGVCAATGSRCSTDGTSQINPNGDAKSCAPYLCAQGQCLQVCASSSDCTSGYSCDPTSRACTNQASGTGSSGGCAMGEGASNGGAVAFSILGALGLLGVLSRRARARTNHGHDA